jgi:hemerythrin
MTDELAPRTAAESVEGQHLLQMGFSSAVQEILRLREDRALAVDLMGRLVDLTTTHFEAEERLMRRESYPEVEVHAKTHARLLADMKEAQAALAGAQGEVPPDVVDGVCEALREHIASLDRDYLSWQAEQQSTP